MRWTVLFVFIGVASALRGFGVPVIYSTGIAVFAGCVGIMIIWFVSKRRHVAMHCSSYCPAGVSVWGSVESRRAERASGNQLYFVWRLFCGMRS